MRALKILVLALACAALGAGASAATTKHHAKRMAMAPPPTATAKPGCEYRDINVDPKDAPEFQNAPVIRDQGGTLNATLTLGYSYTTIAGCAVHLRTYNGALVGPTLRVTPRATMNVALQNRIQPLMANPCPMAGHSNTPGMGFDITNLHVHGLHVSPKGNSDNVFVQVCPPGTQGRTDFPFQFKLGENGSLQPAGTNWYHPHLHGSTALQVASGAEGALIVEGGQDALPQIAAAKQQVMVLQEISYNDQGVIEDYNNIGSWTTYKRSITVNGQVQPIIRMRPGEVQYWRLIDAGISESMLLYAYDAQTGERVALNEIATDGNALGHIDAWKSKVLDLEPGYRSDVLFKAPMQAPGEKRYYYLSTAAITGTSRLQALIPGIDDANPAAVREAYDTVDPKQNVLFIEVSGDANDMALPSDAQLAPFRTFKDITDDEIAGQPVQKVVFASGKRICDPSQPTQPCTTPCSSGDNCANRFMVNDLPYTDEVTRTLTLGKASEWEVSTDPTSGSAQHPFHIHVNPFEMTRIGPDGRPEKVWKDTVLVKADEHTPDNPLRLRSRYEDFDGKFVMHCHILNHEDKGMMVNVEIVK